MKSGSIATRLFGALWLALAAIAAHAASPSYVITPEDNNRNTSADDQLSMTKLRWPDGIVPQFYLASIQGQTFLTASNFYNLETFGLLQAINSALTTWNNAEHATFRFAPGVILSEFGPVFSLPNGQAYQPFQARLDGLNVISLFETSTVINQAAGLARQAFFQRDVDDVYEFLAVQGNLPPNVRISQNNSNTYLTNPLGIDLTGDNLPDLFLQKNSYKAGELIDVDITLDSASAVSVLRLWPESESDVPGADLAQVAGSLDAQALFTYLFGEARGIGNSMLADATMYPFFIGSSSTTSSYFEQPYRRRKLSFDDQLAVGFADHDGDFGGAETGEISGTVIDGRRAAVQTPAQTVDEFVPMAPVFLMARPEQMGGSKLSGGRPVIPSGDSPDDVNAIPFDSTSPERGVWRKVAQVLSGRNFAIPLGAGAAANVNLLSLTNPQGFAVRVPPTALPGTGVTPAPPGQPTLLNQQLDSSFFFPALPTASDGGTTIPYTLYLNNTSTVNVHEAQMVLRAALAAETIPTEFYGGGNAIANTGSGAFTFTIQADAPFDDIFSNNYIAGQVNNAGRIGLQVIDGPSLLSGAINEPPQSYIEVSDDTGSVTNRAGPIGAIADAVQINDQADSVVAAYLRDGEFQLRMNAVVIVTQGGINGIPDGLRVTYTLVNKGLARKTFTFRQALDTVSFGSDNPVYVVNGVPVDNAISLDGLEIPRRITFQSSASEPALTGFIDLRGFGLQTPDRVTIAGFDDLDRTFEDGGYPIRGYGSKVSDTGIALEWNNLDLGPDEGATFSFIIGVLPAGVIKDTWFPMTQAQFLAGNLAPGLDDPNKVEPIELAPGEKSDGAHLVTNTGVQPAAGANNGQLNGALTFNLVDNGLPNTPYVHTGGALADVDLDGDLDLIATGVHGGQFAIESSINRLYENRQRIEPDGSVSYFYEDVTFGVDGAANTADDRLPVSDADTFGIAVADFDIDGDPDIYFANRNTRGNSLSLILNSDDVNYDTLTPQPSQMLINLGTPGSPENAGSFIDASAQWLPGLLNRLLTREDNGAGQFSLPAQDNPSRVAVGDIDSDGDPDLIISQMIPFTDLVYDAFSDTVLTSSSRAWVDTGPRRSPGAGAPTPPGDNLPHSEDDMWSVGLIWTDRVLVNMTRNPPYQNFYNPGPYFTDQTLGLDGRAGTLSTTFQIDPSNGFASYTITGNPAADDPLAFAQFMAAIDRMPPVFPTMAGYEAITSGGTATDTPDIVRLNNSPMGSKANQPILGSFFRDNALDLVSIRSNTTGRGIPLPLQITWGIKPPASIDVPGVGGAEDTFVNSPPPDITNPDSQPTVDFPNNQGNYNGTQSAYFRNLDIFENATGSIGFDGVHDGYFMCVNYNFDFALNVQFYTGDPTMFPYYENLSPVQQIGAFTGYYSGGLFPYVMADINPPYYVASDVMPLYIGMPAGHPSQSNQANNDLFGVVATSSLSGMLADWTNLGNPSPIVLPVNALPVIFDPALNAYSGDGYDREFRRVNDTSPYQVGGAANPYFQGYLEPLAQTGGTGVNMGPRNLAAQTGRGTSGQHDDFDKDGDEDYFITATANAHIYLNPYLVSFPLTAEPTNQLFAGDSFGAFTNISATGLLPNSAQATLSSVKGDYDLDGDQDLITLSAQSNDLLYQNSLFAGAPNLFSQNDQRMFVDISQRGIPPFSFLNAGLTLKVSAADVDNDGLPDIATASGGEFAPEGDFLMLYHNRGMAAYEQSTYIFKPTGSDFPAPRLLSGFTGIATGEGSGAIANGFISETNFFRDVRFGDLDLDGDQDIVALASTGGNGGNSVRTMFNVDSSEVPTGLFEEYVNSVPDADSIGDGLFYTVDIIPPILDRGAPPPIPGATALVLKNQARAMTLADVNHDGRLDILTGNGFASAGAPNLLLLNSASLFFSDVTDGPDNHLPIDPTTAAGDRTGVIDNTMVVLAADFDHDANIEIIYLNESTQFGPVGFRYLHSTAAPGTLSDGHFRDEPGHFFDTASRQSDFLDTLPRGGAIADFDGIGESTEDANFNGFLDPGEDTNGNGVIDFVDRPTETEDLNGNGALDPGEDVGVFNIDGVLAGAGNHLIDTYDDNNDGVITARRAGVWEGSLDFYVTFDLDTDKVFLNDPSNFRPGYFIDRSLQVFEAPPLPLRTRGVSISDINNDGSPDVAVAVFRGGVTPPVKLLMNSTSVLIDGRVRYGVLRDRTYEIPPIRSMRFQQTDAANVAENLNSFNIWATDVVLTDIDGDGDKDMVISGEGRTAIIPPIGSPEVVLVNRTVGADFNAATRVNQRRLATPVITRLTPSGGKRGDVFTVTVFGQSLSRNVQFNFGDGVEVLSVDNVIAYDPQTLSAVSLTDPQGIDISAIVESGFRADVTLRIADNADLGGRKVMASNPSGGSTVTNEAVFAIYETQATALPETGFRDSAWTLYQ